MRTRMYSSMYAPEERAAASGAARRLAMEHLYRYVRRGQQRAPLQIYKVVLHTYADVSIHQQHASASISVRRGQQRAPLQIYKVVLCQHTSAYVSSIRQHTSAYVRTAAAAPEDLQSRQDADATYAADVC